MFLPNILPAFFPSSRVTPYSLCATGWMINPPIAFRCTLRYSPTRFGDRSRVYGGLAHVNAGHSVYICFVAVRWIGSSVIGWRDFTWSLSGSRLMNECSALNFHTYRCTTALEEKWNHDIATIVFVTIWRETTKAHHWRTGPEFRFLSKPLGATSRSVKEICDRYGAKSNQTKTMLGLRLLLVVGQCYAGPSAGSKIPLMLKVQSSMSYSWTAVIFRSQKYTPFVFDMRLATVCDIVENLTNTRRQPSIHHSRKTDKLSALHSWPGHIHPLLIQLTSTDLCEMIAQRTFDSIVGKFGESA